MENPETNKRRSFYTEQQSNVTQNVLKRRNVLPRFMAVLSQFLFRLGMKEYSSVKTTLCQIASLNACIELGESVDKCLIAW